MKKYISVLSSLIIIVLNLITPVFVLASADTKPTIDIVFEEEIQNKPDSVYWNIGIKTKNVPEQSKVFVHTKKNGKDIEAVRTLFIHKDYARYNIGSLELGTTYEITAIINEGALLKTFSRTTKAPAAQIINTSVVGGTFSYFSFGIPAGTKNLITDSNGKSTFGSITACNNSRTQYLKEHKDAVLTDCISSNTSFEATAQVLTTPATPENMDAQKEITLSEKYNLLAPIDGLKQAPDNIGVYFNLILKIAIGLCAVLAVIMIVIGGVQYMGDESIFGKTEAKSQITSAILGLLIALGSYVLLNTINPELLGGNGVNIKSVSAEIDNEVETVPWTGYSSTGDTTLCPEGFGDVIIGGNKNNKINVCNSVADKLTYMINAAQRAGIILSGSGTRSTADQQVLRVANGCANPALPSSSCNPPTARPGHSMHQAGKAIDFKCNGKQVTRSDDCYQWLTINAAKTYGFKNLASEPWHWSTTGQ